MSSFGSGPQKETNQGAGSNFTKYIGFFKGHVVAVNPTREELNALMGREDKQDDKELTYTDEKHGVRTARVTFWIEVDDRLDAQGNKIFLPYTVMLKDEPRRNQANDRVQLINQAGEDAWPKADEDNKYDKEELFDSFKAFTKINKWKLPNGDLVEKYKEGAKPADVEILADKEYRVAVHGESDLVKFVRVWLHTIDTKHPKCELLPETNKLFNGDFSQLNLFDSPLANRSYGGENVPYGFVGLAYVKVDEEDPEKQFQKIYREFLPAKFMKLINNATERGKDIKECLPDFFAKKDWDKFMKEVTGNYGPDGVYVLEPIRECTQEDLDNDVTTTKQTKIPSDNATY